VRGALSHQPLLRCQDSFSSSRSLHVETLRSVLMLFMIAASRSCRNELPNVQPFTLSAHLLRALTCLSNFLQEVGGLKDGLHQAEERLKGLQAAYEQEKSKAEVRMSHCSGTHFLWGLDLLHA
jgi:hypothetical protein